MKLKFKAQAYKSKPSD